MKWCYRLQHGLGWIEYSSEITENPAQPVVGRSRQSPLGVSAEDSFLDSDVKQACALTTGSMSTMAILRQLSAASPATGVKSAT